ncbi:MAG: Lrp/AsnC family transcriptional regulator [Acidimicrobiales bacterium]
MDSVDRAIIEQLERNGRLTNVELAGLVGLSPSPCLRRVRHLERTGVISGYHARVDPMAAGRGFEVVVLIDMMLKDRATVVAFENRVGELAEVVECRRMFGVPDYLLWVAVSDQVAYEAFLIDHLADLPGVARLTSQLTMKLVKASDRRSG